MNGVENLRRTSRERFLGRKNTYKSWDFSIAMLDYRRVTSQRILVGPFFGPRRGPAFPSAWPVDYNRERKFSESLRL